MNGNMSFFRYLFLSCVMVVSAGLFAQEKRNSFSHDEEMMLMQQIDELSAQKSESFLRVVKNFLSLPLLLEHLKVS